jgi:hypothetical protein
MNNIKRKEGRYTMWRQPGGIQAIFVDSTTYKTHSTHTYIYIDTHTHTHTHTHTQTTRKTKQKQESPKQPKTKEQYNESSSNVALVPRSEPGAEKSIEMSLTFRSTRGESRAKLKSTSVPTQQPQ